MRIFRILLLGFGLVFAPVMALAQAQVAFGSLKGDPTLPVEVTSDQLNVNQSTGVAVFTGSVIVVQGEMRMTAPSVEVNYDKDGRKIARIYATGGVTMTNGGESAEGQEAVYTVDTGNVVMTGDVLLTQGSSAINGKKLTVDLNTGTGVMEGRVQTVFVPASAGP